MHVLFLTYDGLTSLIGQSQVWPYIRGLAEAGHRFEAITFDHADRTQAIGAAVARETDQHGVGWHPQKFRSKPPLLAKVLDHRAMLSAASELVRRGGIDLVHARSYVAADVALKLKRRFGLPFIFDMRGFWADQRRDSGRWPASNPLYAALYRRWKAKEAAMIAEADHIVVLAEAAREVVEGWPSYRGQPVTVIPCCIDHRAFPLRTPEARNRARGALGVAADTTLLVYLGAIGPIYRVDEMLQFYGRLRSARPGARFLFVSHHPLADLEARARALGIDVAPGDLIVRPAEHREVPGLLAAADLAIGFIETGFGSLGVSLTKLGEYLACGLPVVANDGVGDVRRILEGIDGGAVLKSLTPAEIDRVVGDLDRILAINPAGLRSRARALHDMPVALARYREIYDSLERGLTRPR